LLKAESELKLTYIIRLKAFIYIQASL